MFKRLITSVIVSLVTFSAASAQSLNEEKGSKFLASFLAVDIVKYLTDNNSNFYIYPSLTQPVTVDTITALFGENELAGYKEYKDKKIYVSGKIDKIGQQNSKTIKLEFNVTAENHSLLNAELGMSSADELADYRSGQYILLNCDGGIENLIIPTLKKCSVAEKVNEQAQKEGKKIADTFMSGGSLDGLIKNKEAEPIALALFTYAYMAKYFPDDAPCFDFSDIKHCDTNKYISDKNFDKQDYKKTYEANKDRFHLPNQKWKD